MTPLIKKIEAAIKKIDNLDRLYADIALVYTNSIYNSRVIQLNDYLLHSCESGVTDTHYCDHEIIVSLTTYEPRLYETYLAIESIMQQTVKANRIILWLPDSLKTTTLPNTLQLQMKRGLEVRYCKDIRSYKKLIPALRSYPDDAIITIDDDAIYHIDLIEKLVNSYIKDPQFIYFNRGRRINLQDGKLLPYLGWKKCFDMEASVLNFPTGVGGILYPPHIFSDEVFNESVFMNICPFSDDIWFKAMALYNNKLCKKVYTHNRTGNDYLENLSVQNCALHHINHGQQQNDIQLKDVFEKYDLYEKLIVM